MFISAPPYNIYYINNILIHSIPLFSLLCEYYFIRWLFRYQHLAIIILPGCLYTLVNFLFTIISGTPVYPILKWNSFTSVLICLGIGLLYIAVFLLLTYISHIRYKRRREIGDLSTSTSFAKMIDEELNLNETDVQ